ncbi:unnamed protein product [Larinioides sclopetarius]|uniref:Uncharacterized protein n=1 Tax=Larinioides sclopetarius TaxID=280406 RepID=A0AAV2B7H3_9ARAC
MSTLTTGESAEIPGPRGDKPSPFLLTLRDLPPIRRIYWNLFATFHRCDCPVRSVIPKQLSQPLLTFL